MTDTAATPPVQDDPSKSKMPVRSSLKTFFKPQSVALIGATEKAGSVGRTILSNLIASPFGGFKSSGVGRELGPEGLQAYLESKSICLPG